MEDPQRRRPRGRPPADPVAPPEAPRRGPFAIVVWVAAAIVAVVIAIAFATGTADDLPWGAIIGVLAVLAFAILADRRRRAAIEAADDEEP